MASLWSAGTAKGARERQLQEASQVLGLASEFLTNGGNLSRLALRLEGGDQAAQPRAQLGGAKRLIIGEAREIAEQPAEPAQSSRPRFLRAFPRATPQCRDLVIEKRQVSVGQRNSVRRRKQATSIVRCGSLIRISAADFREIIVSRNAPDRRAADPAGPSGRRPIP